MLDGQRGDGTGGARPAIEAIELTKRYRRGKGWFTAVDDVTLAVPGGQVIGLLGPNGAGKTTTIKMACGLIVPTAGTIRLNGYDVGRRRADAVRQIGGCPGGLPQRVLAADRLAEPDVLRAAEGATRHRDQAARRAAAGRPGAVGPARRDGRVLLPRDAAEGRDRRRADHRPAGTAAGRADHRPGRRAARTVKDWIAHLAADEGKTIVLTTHQLPIVQELADRIAVIRDGSIIAALPTGELLSRFAEDRFEVRVAGLLNGFAGALPAGARAEADADSTRVVLRDANQGRLHSFLDDLRASGVPSLPVTQAQPDLEEIFLQLIGAGPRDFQTAHTEAGHAA